MAGRNYSDECGDHGGDGGDCGLAAGWGTDFDSGKCKHHRGTSPDGSSHEGNDFAVGNDGGDGAPENNGHNEQHGLRSDGQKWFARHREEAAEDVRRMVAAWMEDAPFGWENTGNVRLLVDAAINECQIRRGDEFIEEEGAVITEFKGVAEDGREIQERKENPALMAKSRLQRDTVRILEKLGILDDPETQKASSTADLASAIEDKLD